MHQSVEFAKKHQAGSMVAFVEAENSVKLLSFYESYGFKRFDTRQTISKESEPHELIQLSSLMAKKIEHIDFFNVYTLQR